MTINLKAVENKILRPRITVFGVGGAGGNAIDNMISAGLEGADFVIANTDSQALENSSADRRIQLGIGLTKGLGAGAAPDIGEAAAEESAEEIKHVIQGSNMVFITAGMGGGTGTGAAPVIARMAQENGILTVGVVTKPFHFEGAHRMRIAERGLTALQKYVDTLIVIPNQNLFRIANERTTFAEAFKMADEVLHSGVRGITDLITMPGLINLDFADIVTIMNKMGKAMMGMGEAEGENRAIKAAEAAISNPLLDNCSMKGARGVLINITGGTDMTLFEVDEAANRIRDEVDADANIIFGSTFNPNVDGKIRVSIVATGIDSPIEFDRKLTFNTQSFKASSTIEPSREELPCEEYDDNLAEQQEVLNSTAEDNSQVYHSAPLNEEALEDESEDSNNTNDDDSGFMPTAPVVPKIMTATANEAQMRATKPIVASNEKQKPKKAGNIFARMAGSMFRDNPKAEEEKELELVSAEGERKLETNDLEIPAFLRRKN